MAEDWYLDVKKYVPFADDAAIAGIIRHCGIALQSHDASLVAFSDKSETDRVRESFLKKKLALTDPDPDLDRAIAAVGERMKADHTKNRVTVYYLLAEHFGKLGLFSKAPPVVETIADAGAAKAAGIGAGTATLGAAGLAGAGALAGGLGSSADPMPPPIASLEGARMAASGAAARAADVEEEAPGITRWWPWLLLALLVLAVLWYLFAYRHAETPPAPTSDVSATATAPAIPAVPTAPVIPAGAGVTSETRDGKPVVTVYFDTGKTDVVPAFGDAATALKSYLDANAGSKLAVSGFNDKTGNAAFNAELSKHRAQAVQAALVAAKIPESAIDLQKPADATDTGTSNAEARRVEVTIK
jgi:outer membrane protein OmpA-like peptidoglycan-associated protein